VGIEAFDASKFLNYSEGLGHRSLIHFDDAGAALELIGAQTGIRAASAAGGQRVAGAG